MGKSSTTVRNPYKIMHKGTSALTKDKMHRPEAAGNFDNMDDYNEAQLNREGTTLSPKVSGDDIATTGKIGAGTTSPSTQIEIEDAAAAPTLRLDNSGGANSTLIVGDSNRTGSNQAVFGIEADWNGTRVALIDFQTGDDTVNKDDGEIVFYTAAAGSIAEAMRIDNGGKVGIGTATPVTDLDIEGGFAGNLVNKTGAYTATSSDHVITCDGTSGAFTVTLPALSGLGGFILYIKKIDSSANAITVDGNGAENIDGSATKSISTQYQSITIIAGSSEWHIL